ncbi:undecaprenyl-diphosphate phosphatase [Hoyosella rhizosphaerae]|uniref:Undecaprenyl-diphosphatase n=1 Tax=Hoyosella rhizosphaerae TaxID=1755582 RepID=A0A916UKU4_9ACTN|nr:undecaprenyl-diphosphate phosphatase [Hoyosella rhizosphaerae]MBN4925414.1 undecaprenyl-diphosphate phosphatase [Hoyosella rhizosphaerae]GGC75363.1 undecaprenyl-diphosphatase [Hoyosella rhizosphaerae]
MTIFEALILGIVQGVFMFVPVSSTSHLALVQHVMIGGGSSMPAPDSPEMILFDIIVHVGTLVSIVIVMWTPLSALVRGFARDLGRYARGGSERPTVRELTFVRLFALGAITVGVTGVLGLLIRAYGTDVFATPALIAIALIITGGILWWTDSVGPRWRGVGQLTVWVAIMIGIAQAAALVPGFSRSGLTIAMALLLGLHRPLAAQFSFFVAIPTILSAAVVQGWSVVGASDLQIDIAAYVVAFIAAAAVGAVALGLVLKLLYAAKFRYFAVYVWILAAVVLLVQPAMHA